MRVRSPAGSFVVELFKKSGDPVEEGMPLLRLDVEDERQEIARIKRLIGLAEASLAQLEGKSTVSKRAILQLSLEVAVSYRKYADAAVVTANDLFKVGPTLQIDVDQCVAEAEEARAKVEKAQHMQVLFEENLSHNLAVCRASIEHLKSELGYAELKKGEAVLLSPVAGIVTYRVGVGSFVKQGGMLAMISAT